MIEINLLAHREAKRKADIRETIGLLVLGVVALAGGIYYLGGAVDAEVATAEASVRQLKANIEQYRPQEKQVAEFKTKKEQLQLKLDVIDGLDRARSGPVKLLDELATRTPERLWLTVLSTQGRNVTLEGESLDTGIVADFLRGLNESPYFGNVDLNKTERGRSRQGIKVVEFKITAEMVNPADTTTDAGEQA